MPRNGPVPHAGPLDATTGAQRDGIILPSAVYPSAAGGVTVSAEYVNHGWKGLRLFIDTTAVGVGGTVVVKIQTRDPASGNWVDIPSATTGSINTNTTTTLTLYPGQSETGNVDIADPLGVRWRVHVTVGTNDVTLSVGGDYLDG